MTRSTVEEAEYDNEKLRETEQADLPKNVTLRYVNISACASANSGAGTLHTERRNKYALKTNSHQELVALSALA